MKWQDVPGYKNMYSVSEHGEIISVGKWRQHLIKRLVKNKGYQVCLLLGAKRTGVYLRRLYVHDIVGNAFLPNPKGYKNLVFKDGNQYNPCVDNLKWVE